jgi:hypothetical protein
MQYAKDTNVSVAQSRAEIEEITMKYGASGFGSGFQGDRAMVMFEMHNRRVRFLLPLPARSDVRFTTQITNQHSSTRRPRSPEAAAAAWEQACRQRWRALLLAIKAKLEAVECKISEFDSEFLANIVMPDGSTVGEKIVPQMETIAKTGKLPPMLGAPRE